MGVVWCGVCLSFVSRDNPVLGAVGNGRELELLQHVR